MIWLLIIGIGFAVAITIFWLLQWRSDKTYRPTKEQIRKILLSSIEDTIDQGTFDEFSCVRIAYNRELDAIREKYNQIVNNPEYIDTVISPELVVSLNEIGKSKLRELINDLDAVTT